MSINEFYEWVEYYFEEPFIADRLEIQMATVCMMIAGFGNSKSKHSDFMIRQPKKEPIKQEDYNKQIIAAFSSV